MARVRFSIDFEDGLQWRLVEPGHMGTRNVYSLTEEEHADFVAVLARYEEWQIKLGQLNPDGWKPPPPPTKEDLAQLELREYQLSYEYLEKIAPLPK